MKKTKNLKRIISGLLCTAVVVTSLPWLEAMAETTYTEITSREDVDVALRMGVIADSQYTVGAGTEKLNSALNTFNTIDPNYDGLAMVGDIVYQSSTTEVKTDVYELLDTSLSTYVKNGEDAKPYIFAMGNHEFPLNLSNSTNSDLVTTAKTEYFNRYCDEETDTYDSATNEGPYINKVFNGYHFITAAPIDYSNQLSTASEEWILEQVDAAIEEDADKPVFVLLHQPIQNTAYGSSTVRYSETFKSELQKRPQVVVLSGHTHYATNDPRMIWQDGFSLVMIGCAGGGMNARYTGYAEGNEATLLEVDDNNVVSFYRIDVNSQTYIGEPWVLDIPAMVEDATDGTYDTNTWKYTSARKETSATPAFPETAKISVTALDTSSFTIEFPQLSNHETDNDVIVGYRIQVINQKTQSQVQNYSVSSDYYTATKVDTLSETISALASDTEYTVNVYAVSAWGKESAPLTRTVYTKQGSTTSDTETETDTRETISQYISQAKASTTVSEYGDGTGTYGWMFGEKVSITYTFEVTTSGKYELSTVAGVNTGGSLAVTVDGVKFDSITVPSGNVDTKNKISAGYYTLSAGTHTVKFTAETGSSAIQMWSASLAKEENAVIKTVQAEEYKNTTITNGHANEINSGHLAFWGNSSVTFNASIPKNGTYDVYVDTGTSGTSNSWSATIENQTVSSACPNTGSYTTFCRQKLGSVDLSKGTHTLTMELTCSGTTSLRRVIFVQENTMFYEITKEAVEGTFTELSGGTAYGSGWGCAFYNGYISFTVTPEYSGVYDLSWNFASAGCTGSTYINGELIDSRNYTGGTPSTTDRVFQSIGNVILEAGETYAIKIADHASGNALNIERLVLTYLREVTLEDGITINAFAGDNVDTNVPTNIQYGDGKDSAGFSFSAEQYIEFDVEIAQAGLYEVALQLGNAEASGVASLSVYADSSLVQTKDAANSGHFDTKLLNEWGEVVLQEGTHRFRVESHSGGVHFFKLQLTSVRGILDTDPYKITIPATSYNAGNLTGDSKVEGESVVLANDSSYVQYDIDIPAGNYALTIRYSRNANSKLGLIVNGEAVGSYALSPVSSYTTKTLGVVSMEEGVNSIRIKRSSSYFYFTYIQLEKITEPVSELYSGDYIVTGENIAQEFTGTTGNLIARTYLPASMQGQYVQLIAGIYEGDNLVKSVMSKPVTADVNSVVIARFEDVALDESKTYTWKVQDYGQYTFEHAGIADGASAVSGTLCDDADTAIAGTAYDKVVFASKLIFDNEDATMSYADNIKMKLNADGDLVVTGLGDSEVVIEPEQFGFTTFKGQVFELQITTDVTDDTTTVGLWIDKKLANNTWYAVSTTTLGSGVAFNASGITHYSLWRIAQPDSTGVSFVQMLKGSPYIVTDDTFIDASSNSYEIGSKITVAGEYTATTGVQTLHLVLWKKYDLHADGACDVRDLVAMKKVESEAQTMPDTKAGKMAASELDSAYELVTMRQELVDTED